LSGQFITSKCLADTSALVPHSTGAILLDLRVGTLLEEEEEEEEEGIKEI